MVHIFSKSAHDVVERQEEMKISVSRKLNTK